MSLRGEDEGIYPECVVFLIICIELSVNCIVDLLLLGSRLRSGVNDKSN